VLRTSEVFHSIQGEGVYQGIPTVFIRLQGCNLPGTTGGCLYCDTSYAWDPTKGKDMAIEEIIQEVSKLASSYGSWCCITGGEPLWQEDELEELVRKLKKGGYKVTIETNGSFNPPRWYTLVDSWSADIKCPSSGVCGVSKEDWFHTRGSDQIKMVVGNTEDLEFVKGMLDKYRASSPIVLLSPISGILVNKGEYWNKEWLREVWEFCCENKVRFSLQIHKILFGDKRGV